MAYLTCLEGKELEQLSDGFPKVKSFWKVLPYFLLLKRGKPRGQGSQGQGPSFLASLGRSDLGALIAALFRRASAAFLGELPFPWLKEPTFCLNY